MRKVPLRQARLDKGMSQIQVSFKTGLAVSQSLYSSIERGYRRLNDSEEKMIAAAIGMQPERIEWPIYLGDLNPENTKTA